MAQVHFPREAGTGAPKTDLRRLTDEEIAALGLDAETFAYWAEMADDLSAAALWLGVCCSITLAVGIGVALVKVVGL